MSPLTHGYGPLVEESAPSFSHGLPQGGMVAGAVWGLMWYFFDVTSFLLTWLVSTFMTGTLLYIVWLRLVIHRYRHSANNPVVSEIVERARQKVGYSERVEVWERKSDKLILMGLRTALFAAVLVSDIAVRDISQNATDGEVAIAYKIAHFSRTDPIVLVIGAGLAFVAGVMFEGLAFAGVVLTSFNDPASSAFMIALLALTVIVMFSVIARNKGREQPFEKVEKLYGIPPAVAMMRVFGKTEIAEEEVEDYYREFKAKAKEEDRDARRRTKRQSIIVWAIGAALSFSFFSLISRQSGLVPIVVNLLFSAAMGGIIAAIVFMMLTFRHVFTTKKGKKHEREEPEDAALYQDPLAAETESLLIEEKGFSGYHVRLINEGRDKGAVVVLRPRGFAPRDSVCYVPASLVKLIHEAEMLAPYIVYDVAGGKMMRKQNTWAFLFAVPALILFFVLLFGSVFSGDLGSGFLLRFFAALILLLLWMGISSVIFRAWSRSALFKLDLRLAEKHTGHAIALKMLLDEGYATDLGRIPLSERLDHIKLGLDT